MVCSRNFAAMVRGATIAAGLTAATALAGALPAMAQDTPESPEDAGARAGDEPRPGETVMSRERPDYDPVGVRLGGFFFYPQVSLAEIYQDNIFYDDQNEESDFITVVSPAARLQSNWDRHALSFYADADIGRYLDNTDENYVDARAGADGRLDITGDANLAAGVSAAHLHEDRSSPDQAGAAEPVTYRRYAADATLTKRFNRLVTSVGTDVAFFRYDNVDATGGGTFVSDDRDRHELGANARVGYELSSRIEPFLRVRANDRTYEDDVDSAGVSRDSQGWEAVGGVELDFGGVTFGEVFAGYLEQEYDRPGFGTISGPSFGANLTWNPTGLTTVEVGAERTVEETTLNGAAGALQSAFRAGVDHELRRNIILSGDTRYVVRDYEGIAREDDTMGAGVGATYLANEYLEFGARYSYDTRDSSVAGADYDVQTLLLRVTGQL